MRIITTSTQAESKSPCVLMSCRWFFPVASTSRLNFHLITCWSSQSWLWHMWWSSAQSNIQDFCLWYYLLSLNVKSICRYILKLVLEDLIQLYRELDGFVVDVKTRVCISQFYVYPDRFSKTVQRLYMEGIHKTLQRQQTLGYHNNNKDALLSSRTNMDAIETIISNATPISWVNEKKKEKT